MNCECVKKANEALVEHNTEIDTAMAIGFNKTAGKTRADMGAVLLVPTRKINSRVRKGPVRLHVNFCPLCGLKQASRANLETA
jgi:hypothetical protein